MSTFVTVGTALEPFSRLLDEVARLARAGCLPRPVIVQHGNTPFQSADCVAKAFVDRAEFQDHICQAQLVITHGGLTVLQALHHGKVPVVMPRRGCYGEVVDDHQVQFSQARAEAGEVLVALEPADLLDAARRALAIQSSPERQLHNPAEPPLIGEIREFLNKLEQQRAYKAHAH